MKAVLVVDTPKTCKECRCQMMLVCVPADEDIDEYVNPSTTIPKWCPLRPLPLKGTMENVNECEYNRGFVDGRNHCIELITGEIE